MLVPQSAPDLWEVGHAVDYLSYEVSPTGRAALTEHHFRHGVQWLFHKISNSTTVPGIVGVVTFSGGGPGMPSPSPTPPGGFGPAGRGRPYPFVTVTVWAASGPLKGKLMASTVPNAQALFALDLLPGRYLVKAVPPAGGAIPTRSSRRAVIVRVGQRTCVILIVAGR
jgi:hypothetical protein